MAVTGTGVVWPNYSSQNAQKATNTGSTELGKDEFLEILVTQLQNQDPMQPMEDKDFIAQMAQFSSLEQMLNMTNQMTALRQAPGMAAMVLGMNVQWTETDSSGNSAVKNGTVSSVFLRDGVQYVKVGDSDVKMEDITSISLPAADDGTGGNASE
ncbi:flagellar hook capping FlgD N-terminal domain-containing protein [Cohnella zeiphila]|uniref:Flagellar hook capping protein n=1 Tax=Cohnella zeiphila TaxID=2761120 RepID=A0A7X0SPW2_9BACL|nr:flagellar hook capping FlgD N-terminal domain-containing protein [Cohnella zeiphila]MBB6732854.1 flagellar hook capping protein [Cohnella zeiphila]